MIEISQWRASVGLFNSSTTCSLKIACSSNIFIHMLFALHFNFILLLPLFRPSMCLINYINNQFCFVSGNHWLLLVNALLLWNLSFKLNLLSGDIHPNPGPNSVNLPATHNNLHFSIVHLNIRSILAPKKLTDLIAFTTGLHDFVIITLPQL